MPRSRNGIFLIVFMLLSVAVQAHSSTTAESALGNLYEAIRNKKLYDQQHKADINSIKRLLTDELTLQQQFHFNSIISREYKKFQLDSAIVYATKNIEIAIRLKDNNLLNQTQTQLATLYSSSGKYRESEDLLKNIGKRILSKAELQNYYEAYCLFWGHYSSNTQSGVYVNRIDAYRDSLLAMLSQGSFLYAVTKAEKMIYQRKCGEQAKSTLENLLRSMHADTPDYAMVTYLLGLIYQHEYAMDKAIQYFALSATADIRNSLKDNASMQNLASIFYDRGDVETAYIFAQSALEDAFFCNIHFRTIRLSQFYTIINTAYLDKKAKNKEQLQKYLLLTSILSVLLLLAIIYVYQQMRRVSGIRKELDRMNKQLQELNREISDTNLQLHERNALLIESNRVKEDYIAHFFGLCSTYIDKLESYRKSLNKKVNENKLDELFKILKSNTLVDSELEELYHNFDTTFINLYPTFVEDFNALRVEGEQVHPKPGRVLNTELRVFALIRLGITDSMKIAAFLRYSLSTIYNYRTKARGKSNVPREEFEEMIMTIGTRNPNH